MPSGTTSLHRDLVVELAARYRLPSVYPFRFYITAGGLMSYSSDLVDQSRQAASYVDRILRGASPRRTSGAGTDQVRNGDQPENSEGARPQRTTFAAGTRRRGDRITNSSLRCMSPEVDPSRRARVTAKYLLLEVKLTRAGGSATSALIRRFPCIPLVSTQHPASCCSRRNDCHLFPFNVQLRRNATLKERQSLCKEECHEEVAYGHFGSGPTRCKRSKPRNHCSGQGLRFPWRVWRRRLGAWRLGPWWLGRCWIRPRGRRARRCRNRRPVLWRWLPL